MNTNISDNNINFSAKYKFKGYIPKNIKRIFRNEDCLPDNFVVRIKALKPQQWTDHGINKETNSVNVKVRDKDGTFKGSGVFSVINKDFVGFCAKVRAYLDSLV